MTDNETKIMKHYRQVVQESLEEEKKVLEVFAKFAKNFSFSNRGSNLLTYIDATTVRNIGEFVGVLGDEAGRAYQMEKFATTFLLNSETPNLELVDTKTCREIEEYNEIVASNSLGEFIANCCYTFGETENLGGIYFLKNESDPRAVWVLVEERTITGPVRILVSFALFFDQDV